jgi:hypothetical protein
VARPDELRQERQWPVEPTQAFAGPPAVADQFTEITITPSLFNLIGGHTAEVCRELLVYSQPFVELPLCLRWLSLTGQQDPWVVVAARQVPPVDGHCGELGGQLLLDGQPLAVLHFFLRWFPQIFQQIPQVDVAAGQYLLLLGHVGEVDGQGLVAVQSHLKCRTSLFHATQPVLDQPNAIRRFRGTDAGLLVVRFLPRELPVVGQHFGQELLLLGSDLLLRHERIAGDLRDHRVKYIGGAGVGFLRPGALGGLPLLGLSLPFGPVPLPLLSPFRFLPLLVRIDFRQPFRFGRPLGTEQAPCCLRDARQ